VALREGWRWWTPGRSIIVLAVLVASIVGNPPAPWSALRGLVVALGLVAATLGWLAWTLFPADRARVAVGAAATGIAGVVLILAGALPAAWFFPPVACSAAGRRVRPAYGGGLAIGLALLLGAGLPLGFPLSSWALGLVSLALGLLAGVARRQGDELQEKTERAREERARAEILAERSRLAREVHDVLAHSLGALTVQLELADALLEAERYGPARESVVRAGQFARDGLAEVRRAVGALRGDPLPLPRLLSELAGGYEGEARVTVEPATPELPAEVALGLFRTAQEALTNVRKHAPGAPVEITLGYADGEVALSVVNGPPAEPAPSSLAPTGGGYGLAGMRERAELAGGDFSAGPADQGWRVRVRIPL
jgi:signal transduction histidine kinase